jgi:hypothetical protein
LLAQFSADVAFIPTKFLRAKPRQADFLRFERESRVVVVRKASNAGTLKPGISCGARGITHGSSMHFYLRWQHLCPIPAAVPQPLLWNQLLNLR